MTDPTPEERAEALRLVEEEFAYQAASGSTRAAMALEAARDALRAVESERAELAEWLERKTQYQEKQADRIAELAREVEIVTKQSDDWQTEASRLEAEVEELREALRRISNETRTDWLAARIARAALSNPGRASEDISLRR